MKKIGVIGLGIMGTAMTHRLLAAGYEVRVYNRNKERAEGVLRAGAKWSDSPSELAAASDVVITMLADDAALEAVVLDSGLCSAMAPGSVLMNMSTVSMEMTERIVAACAASRLRFLDAPVSGSKPQAETGELVILAGGERATIEECEAILLTLGKKIVYAGAPGKGTALKLAVNLMLAHLAAALAEGLAFCTASDLDPNLLLETLANAPALNAGYFQYKGKRVLAGDLTPQFPLKHMLKDVRLVNELTTEHLAVTSAIQKLIEENVAEGKGELDVSAVEARQ